MSWLYETIAGRTILVLVIGIGGVLLLSLMIYEMAFEREARLRDVARLADRLIVLEQSMLRLPPQKRDEAAHALSGGPVEVHWSRERLAAPGGDGDAEAADLRKRLLAHAPALGKREVVIGSSPKLPSDHGQPNAADGAHTILISKALEDGSWINVSVVNLHGPRLATPSFLISALMMVLGTILVSILMARWLTRPLRELTTATHGLFSTGDPAPVPEAGTREIRELGSAINELQRRIGRLLFDRTQTLAAVSHDLRTPLTRLRLRLEDTGDDANRASAAVDIGEMEEMLDATLAFLKGESGDEKVQTLDLAAVIETIASDMSDASADVHVAGARHAILKGRRLALKRAFNNIIQNAVKYGERARVSISDTDAAIEVSVDDDGPGIPDSETEAVFSPFYRIEGSRSRETGGHGLGLTVARTIVRAHGGDIALSNRDPRGLRLIVSLPKSL